MEHRWSVRKDMYLDVVLDSDKGERINARTLNIGLEGMFIETDPLAYSEGHVVDIILESPNRDNKVFNIRGIVTYTNDTGIGVMLIGFDLEVFQAMQRVLYCGSPVLHSDIDQQSLINIYSG